MSARGRGGRLISIDALRGVAALSVVAFHCVGRNVRVGPEWMPQWLGEVVARAMTLGWTGVMLFFVISGFCIHLKWARDRADGLDPVVDFGAFWRRRIRRLYPPYLIALCLFLVPEVWSGRYPLNRFAAYDIGLHLIMAHNLDFRTTYSFAGVFWTLAIEEQLYLAYFVLLWLRGRGWFLTLAVCLLTRLLWFVLATVVNRLGHPLPYTETGPAQWFGWALGALAVESAFGVVRLPRWCSSLALAVPALAAAVACEIPLKAGLGGPIGTQVSWLLGDTFWALGSFAVLNALVAREPSWRLGSVPRVVTMLAAVGTISYSLYLIHEFVFEYLVLPMLSGLNLSGLPMLRLALLPAIAATALPFYYLFERPFINTTPSPTPMPAPVASA